MAQSSSSASKAGTSATDSDDLSAQIATLRKDVETLSEMLRDVVANKVSSVRSQAHDAADEAKMAAQRQARQAMDTAQHYQHEAEAAVRNNPSAALAIATGIGFIAGLLLSRR